MNGVPVLGADHYDVVGILKASGDRLRLTLLREVTRLVPPPSSGVSADTSAAADIPAADATADTTDDTDTSAVGEDRTPAHAATAHVARQREETQARLRQELEGRRAELRPPDSPQPPAPASAATPVS